MIGPLSHSIVVFCRDHCMRDELIERMYDKLSFIGVKTPSDHIDDKHHSYDNDKKKLHTH